MRHLSWVLVLAALSPAESQEPPPLPALKELHRIADKDVRSAAFDSDSTRLAVAGRRLLRILDIPFGGASRDIPVPDELTELAWEPTDLYLVTRAFSGHTRLVSMPKGEDVRYRAEARRPEESGPKPPGRGPLAFTPAGTHLALANQGEGFRIWSMELAAGKTPEIPEVNVTAWRDARLDHVTALRFSGSWLLVGHEGGYLTPFDHRNLDPEEDPAGKEIIRGTRSGAARGSLKTAYAFQPHTLDVTSMALTPNQEWLLTAGWEGAVKLWKVDDHVLSRLPQSRHPSRAPKPVATIKGRHLAYHPARGIVAVTERSGIRLYKLLPGSDRPFVEEAFAPIPATLGGPVRAIFNRTGDLLSVICCPCGICKGGTAPGQDGTRRAYDHGGKLIVFDAKNYVTADGKKEGQP